MANLWLKSIALIIKYKIGEYVWRDLVNFVQEAENSGAENKSKWVLEKMSIHNISNWLKNLSLEIAVGYVKKKAD